MSVISDQQKLVTEVLEATNRIDAIVDETVIIVPDIKHETQMIRTKLMRIFELEQLALLDMVFGKDNAS